MYSTLKIHKSYKFRLDPTVTQKELLAKHFGSCRFVFNHFLGMRKEIYLKEKTSLTYQDTCSSLTQLKKEEDFIWLREIGAQSLQQSLRNLDTAYKRFFNKQSRFPQFKSKYDKQSFRIPQRVKVEGNRLRISKFQEGIKMNLHREIEGKILFATISKSKTGKYYVSITCEVEHKPFDKTGSQVGIDTGVKDLAILSDGTVYENIKALKTRLKKLKYEQRQLSKKTKGRNSRNRQRVKVARVHEKIANIRKDYLHKVSTKIVKNHDVIAVEDLAVKNMMKNHCLAQALSDVSLGSFYEMLRYKAEWNDKSYVKIDRFFPSSKTCSSCGWINQNLTLSIREWTCESCGSHHDRDFNAAKNILIQGLNLLSGCGIQSEVKQKQEEASSLDESMSPDTQLE